MDKIRTGLSILSGATEETSSGLTGETRAIVTPEKRIFNKENKEKSLAMYPPGKDPIPNQDKKTLGLQNNNAFHHTNLHLLLEFNH